MAYQYIIPYILPLPLDYDCTIALPASAVGKRLKNGTGAVSWRVVCFHDGELVDEMERQLIFEDGRLSNSACTTYVWNGTHHEWSGNSGYMEIHFDADDEDTFFSTKDCIEFYALYSAPGKKTFRADGTFKFASPPTIAQIAAFGEFCEGYPSVRIDQARNYGESFVLINPYEKPILVTLATPDDRKLSRLRVPPRSGRNLVLADLLQLHGKSFVSRFQLKASNRIVLFHVRHSMSGPYVITDHEHLDPYRSDPTHVPAFQKLRLAIGYFLDRRFNINWSKP